MSEPLSKPVTDPKYEKPNPKELAGDILFVQNACRAITGAAEAAGVEISPEEKAEIDAIIALDSLPAKAVAMGALTGLVGPEVIYQSWARTRNAIDFLARHALSIMTECLDGRKISAQQMRICEKLIEWSGIQTAAGPAQSDADKFRQMERGDIAKLTDEELHAKLMKALNKKG